ncbi:hypothetical protein V1478_001637 [Vespula squamosa]|uniref:Uncharacterized protein n=1 Tax=Vespula squamosa TaxID=30214 RepID=A0ABD2C216_VESSQ
MKRCVHLVTNQKSSTNRKITSECASGEGQCRDAASRWASTIVLPNSQMEMLLVPNGPECIRRKAAFVLERSMLMPSSKEKH